jgi:superfamily II DNA or RNA helicase
MESKSNTGPFLVVVPNSTLPNWSSEFEKWAPHIEKVVYKGGPKVRKAIQQDSLLSGAFNVLITTYEFVMSDKHALAKPRWKYIIVDEGHRIKNHKSKLSVILGSYYHAVNRVLLTGTPLHNNLPELWALLNFLLPTIFNSVNDFESWFNAPFERTGERIEMSEEEELLVINRLHQVLRPFLLRRLKSEVMLELPDKVEKVIKCELSSWQVHMYRRVLEHKGIYTNVGKPGVQQMNNDLVQLRKICNHPHLFYNIDDFDETVVTASGKVHMLDRILPKLKAAGHRVLIFTQMTQLMDILEDYFELRNFTYLRLDGSTSVDDRAERMRQFQKENSDYFLFLLSTRAGGMGVNLQSADTVIIFDSDWNPQMDKQAQDRAHRIGQSKEVRVLRLITAGTVEVAILSKSREKDSVDQKVIQAGKFNNRSTDSERRAFLESVVNAGTIELKDDDEPPSDEQLNEMLARDEHELEMYEAIGQQMQVPELMTEHQDIPQWLRAAEAAEDKAEEEAEDTHLGRGARERKRVSYSENDREFEMLLRENEDSGSDDDDRNATSLDSPSGPPSKQQRSSSYPSNAGTGKPYGRGRGRPRGRGGRGRGRPRGRPRKKKDATTKVPAEVDVVRDDDVACLSCKRVDNDSCMILCDGCDNARHTFCCEPPLDRVPEGDWYCGVCEKSPPLWRRTIVELEDSAAGGAVKKQRC